MRRLTISVLLLACALPAEQLPYRLFTTADGLIRNFVHRIRRDPNGYLWICTMEGMSLFDGWHFTNYTVADGLPDRRVYDILPAGDGTYWLATGAGLSRFRPRRALQRGQSPEPLFVPVAGAGSGAMRVLFQDQHGVVWAGGNPGLYRLRPGSGQPRLQPVPLRPPGVTVLSLYEDRLDRLWVGTGDGLYRFAAHAAEAALVYAGYVYGMHLDSQGRLWVAGWRLVCLDPDSDPVRLVETVGEGASPALGQRVFGLLATRDGDLWLAGHGLVRFRPGAVDPHERVKTFETSDDLGREFLSAVEQDSAGDLWVGVDQIGLARVGRDRFVKYTEADGLASRNVQGMAESRQGALVAVSGEDYVWNEFSGGQFHAIVPRVPARVRSGGWGLSRLVQQDRNGDWWAASRDGLLHYPRADSPALLSGAMPKEVLTVRDGLPNSVILQVFEDSHGAIWAGTLKGLARRDPASRRWRGFGIAELVGEAREELPVEAFAEDRAGATWASLPHAGLARFRGTEFQRFTQGVPGSINSLFVDSRGWLWIAARDGLWRIDEPDAAQPRIVPFAGFGGLSSADLYSVSEDASGRIYVAGGRGVDRLDLATGRVRHFTPEDGLPRGVTEVIFRDRRGSMWFSSRSGLSRYDPDPDWATRAPKPLIRGIRVGGRRYMLSDLGETVVTGLELPPGQGGLDIELGAVRLSGERVQFQYRMEGAGADWSAPLDVPSLSLAGLSAGRYRLLVRVVQEGGITSGETAALEFRSMAPFWRSWWFQTLLAAVLAAAAYAFHRVRVDRALELERIRTRIAADLHDDIGASLSQVAVLSEVIHCRSNDRSTVERNAEKIARTSRELVESMSDIVWAINPRHDGLPDLVQRMRQFAGEALIPRNIEMQFDSPRATLPGQLGADVRRQVFLIFKEAVNNSARHSGCTRVDIRMRLDGRWLVLAVSDDGRGFEPGNGAGNGLLNMRRRAESLKAEFEAGRGSSGGASVRVRVPLG